MDHGRNGLADDSRPGRKPEARENEEAVEREDEKERSVSAHDGCVDDSVLSVGEESPEEIAKAVIGEIPADELRRLLISGFSMGQTYQWKGLLPDPDSFGKYPKFAQEKMVEWNDAQIIDESDRSDRLVDAAIGQKKRGQLYTFLLNGLFAVLAFFAFVITEDAASFSLLAVPGATIIVNVALDVRNKKHKTEDDLQGESE